MSSQHLTIRELAAWGFDHPVDRGVFGEEQLRDAASHAHRRLAVRMPYPDNSPIAIEKHSELASLLATRNDTVAMSGAFDGLAWELSIVDLRKLIAFQRRIGSSPRDNRPIQRDASPQELLDLALPLQPLSQSPYIEVASYRDRWFLRDGYHRSFRLMKQSVYLIPCVVVRAESLTQMGAIGRQFFPEEVLFSKRPPMVTDFLDEELNVHYSRAVTEQSTPSTIHQLPELIAANCRQQEGL